MKSAYQAILAPSFALTSLALLGVSGCTETAYQQPPPPRGGYCSELKNREWT
jgi:hypothetical protein